MQTIFCTECGSKNEYSSKKPNFCSSCGFSFVDQKSNQTDAKASNKKPIRRSRPNVPQVELAEDETDIDYVPSISSLSYEITSEGNNIHKFEDIVDAAQDKQEK